MSDTLHRVLYVEDEPDIRTIVGICLRLGGLSLKICSTGARAIEVAEAFAPDLLLLDVMMPEMDGPSTLRNLRQIPGLAAVPVVFMTAKVQASELAGYRKLGALDVIPKPFEPTTLASRLRAIWATRADAE